MIHFFTYSFNSIAYLSYQYDCLKKFCEEDYQLHCIDNAIDNNVSAALQNVCSTKNIEYHKNLQPDHSLHGRSHYAAMQWSWNNIISKQNDICVMTDHDTFAIKSFGIKSMLGEADVVGAPQSRETITYIHPSFMIWNIPNLPDKNKVDFNGETVDGIRCDIGGQLAIYFREHTEVKLKFIKNMIVSNTDGIIPNHLVNSYTYPVNPFEIIDDTFFHARLGSNWSYIPKTQFDIRNNIVYDTLNYYLGNK